MKFNEFGEFEGLSWEIFAIETKRESMRSTMIIWDQLLEAELEVSKISKFCTSYEANIHLIEESNRKFGKETLGHYFYIFYEGPAKFLFYYRASHFESVFLH